MIKEYKYSVTSIYKPFIFTGPGTGKLYIMPGWLNCDENTTMEDIQWVRPNVNANKFLKKFTSSKNPEIEYTVSKKGNEYICTCPGYLYRNRLCRHIKTFLS